MNIQHTPLAEPYATLSLPIDAAVHDCLDSIDEVLVPVISVFVRVGLLNEDV